MEHIHATIVSNRQIANGYYELKFQCPLNSTTPVPGQFLTIRPTETNVPLLRRPFAYSSWDASKEIGAIIYQKRGSSTEILSAKSSGDSIDLLGPLGNSFPISVDMAEDRSRPILLAGGIGMGPMFFFARNLKERGYDPLLLIGARNASLIPEIATYSAVETIVATDDGSYESSFKGNIIQALESHLQDHPSKMVPELYACGPHVMMHAAWNFAEKNGWPLWVSMEQTMGCGVGACMGCTVKVHDEKQYARVCSEGPVFPGGYIEW